MTPEAWVKTAIDELRSADSWTGRVHIHKCLFVLSALELRSTPFRFELYHYGPYSRGLDSCIASMEAFGEIDREYPKSGYGPKYFVIDDTEDDQLSEEDQEAVHKVAFQFGSKTSSELEVIATAIWVKRCENISDRNRIEARIKEIKPKYSETDISQLTSVAEDLEQALA